jgi:hypothetical protein
MLKSGYAMAHTLVRGQRLKLTDAGLGTRFSLELVATGLDAAGVLAAIITDGQDQALGREQLLWQHGAATHTSGFGLARATSTTPTRLVVDVDLEKLPTSTAKIVVVASFGDVAPGEVKPGDVRSLGLGLQLFDGAQVKATLQPKAEDYGHERGLVLVQFYRKDGVWRVFAAGDGFYDGLVGLKRHLGLEDGWLQRPGQSVQDTQGAQRGQEGAQRGQASSTAAEPAASRQWIPPVLPETWPGGVVPKLPSGLTSAVAFVVVKLSDGRQATGTGFCITPGGHLLTCAHVVEEAVLVAVKTEGSDELREAVVLAVAPEHDLALLWLPDGAGTAHWLRLSLQETPELGEELGLLAYPLGQSLGSGITYSQGIVNGVRQQDNIPFLQIDTGAAPGSSGGPIFRRRDGVVIGLLHGGLRSEAHNMTINLGVDIRNLKGLGWVRETIRRQ